MLKSKPLQSAEVVELRNDWQQVGGVLGNVMANLKVVPVAKSKASNCSQEKQPQMRNIRKAA